MRAVCRDENPICANMSRCKCVIWRTNRVRRRIGNIDNGRALISQKINYWTRAIREIAFEIDSNLHLIKISIDERRECRRNNATIDGATYTSMIRSRGGRELGQWYCIQFYLSIVFRQQFDWNNQTITSLCWKILSAKFRFNTMCPNYRNVAIAWTAEEMMSMPNAITAESPIQRLNVIKNKTNSQKLQNGCRQTKKHSQKFPFNSVALKKYLIKISRGNDVNIRESVRENQMSAQCARNSQIEGILLLYGINERVRPA